MSDEHANGPRHRTGPWHEGVTIQRWQLGNFKSVQHADVELSPLTVLVGANSAGKSSLIQSILAVSQAAGADVSSDLFPLNGGILRLGTVEQNRYAGPGTDGPRPISFGGHFQMGSDYRSWTPAAPRRRRPQHSGGHCHVDWRLMLGDAPADQSGQARISSIHFDVEYDHVLDIDEGQGPSQLSAFATPQAKGGDRLQGQWHIGGSELRLASVALRGGLPVSGLVERSLAEVAWEVWNDAYRMNLERESWVRAQERRRPLGDESQLSLTADDESRVDGTAVVRRIVADILEAYRSIGQPATLQAGDQRRLHRQDVKLALRRALRERYAEQLPDLPRQVLYNADVATLVLQALEHSEASGLVPIADPLEAVSTPARDLIGFLAERVWYLGPLREDPRVVYQDTADARNGYVGAKGEYLAAVLQSSGRYMVEVPMPGIKPGGRLPTVTLNEALNAWIQYLEVGHTVSTTDMGRLGLELSVQEEHVDIPLDLTSVGTGVSQLLPVLVLCLRSPRGALLMMEQPELHLNPGVQQRLADFLLAVARSGRQVLVETHSEYLISRLRLHVAQDDTDVVRQTVGLLFAVRTEGSTTYEQVETNEYGGLENWPVGFFDHSAEESRKILKASVDKRRRRQGPKDPHA